MYDANNIQNGLQNGGQQSLPSEILPSLDWLSDEIRARRIPVPSNATPAEVIPFVHKFIARYNQIGELIPVSVESRKPWQALIDDWQQFLKKLETASKIRPNIPAQPLPTRPASGQTRPDPANARPKPVQTLPPPVQTLPTPAPSPVVPPSSGSSNLPSTPSTPSIPPKPNPPSPIPDPKSAEPPQSELESADLNDGFKTEHERLAVARCELQDHLAHRPIRIRKLPPEQQTAIYDLLEVSNFSSRAVVKILAEPPPNGFGLAVSKSTLNDWRREYGRILLKEEIRRQAEAERQAALEIIDKSPNPDAAFQQAAERLFKLRILASGGASIDQLDQLVGIFTNLRKQALAERKQLHAEKSK